MNKHLHFLAFLCLASISAISETPLTFVRTSEQALYTAAKLPTDAVLLRAPADMLARASSQDAITIKIPTGEGTWTLELSRFDVLTPDAIVVRGTDRGDVPADVPQHALLRGTVRERPASRVFIAVFETHISAIIEIEEPGGQRRWMVSPDTVITGRQATLVLHEVRTIPGDPEPCHAEELPDYQRRSDAIQSMVNADPRIDDKLLEPRTQGSTVYALQLALDCAYSMYLRHDTSFAYAAQYAITLAGACSAIYERDAQVRLRVPFLRVWTVEDPFAADAIGERLGKIRTGWDSAMKHVQRSTVCYLSGQGGGGLAWVGVLCGNYGYNVSGINGKVNFPSTGYIWDIDVVSHELGHNIGSSHTQNCGWNPPIDSCWIAEGGCYDNTKPQRGTIMSYCHLQWKGTALQFHPRIASLFNRVMERSACMAPVAGVRDTDMAVIEILEPVSGSSISPTRSFTPRVLLRNTGKTNVASSIVRYRVTNNANDTLFTSTQTIDNIASGTVRQVVFPAIKIDQPGPYLLEADVSAANDQHATNNQMTRPFLIGPDPTASIVVVAPNGGEVLVGGDTTRIRFTASNVTSVIVTYSSDAGTSWHTVKTSVAATDSSYLWAVPYISSATCLIKVASLQNARILDVSNEMFAIRTAYDLQVVDILAPGVNDTLATPMTPRVLVRNNGQQPAQNATLRFTTQWVRQVAFSYDTTITLPAIAAGAELAIVLPTTGLLSSGVHVMTATVRLAEDTFPENDLYSRAFTAVGLSAPQSVRIEHGPQRVLLQWQAPEALPTDRIEIWRGSSAVDMTLIKSLRTSVTAWIDERLSDDVQYAYALRVRRDSTTSTFTDQLIATPHTYPAGWELSPPTTVNPSHNAVDIPVPIDLVWTSVRGADRYEVQLSKTNDFADPQYVIITEADDALQAPSQFGDAYTWRVRAINDSYTGPWSIPTAFTATRSCAMTAVQFNGTDTKATNGEFIWNGGPITVEFWQYVARADRANTSTFAIGTSDDTRNRLQAHVPWGDGNIYWDCGSTNDSGRVVGAYTQAFDRWAHIALVSDARSFMSIYIDGQLVASRKGAMEAKDLKSITIGAMRGQLFLKGALDEFRIWNVVRSQDQIRNAMNRRLQTADKVGLVAHWSFNEGGGRTANDASDSGRTLTLTENVRWTVSDALIGCNAEEVIGSPGVSNQVEPLATKHTYSLSWTPVSGALWYEVEVFDTDSDRGTPLHRFRNVQLPRVEVKGLPEGLICAYRVRARSLRGRGPWATGRVRVPDACESQVVQFNADTSYFVSDSLWYQGRATTVEYWSYVGATDIGERSSFSIGETDPAGRRFQAHSPWKDKLVYWDHGNYREGARLTTDVSSYFDKWTHYAVASNGIDEMRIYINGQRVAISDFAGAPGVLRKLAIGANGPSNHQFKGLMSDFRVWNIMRSAEQVRETMYERIVGGRSHLLGSWPLDDGRGVVSEDIAGGARDGVASRAPQWLPDTARSIMHVPPALRGPYVVVKGDTATYTLHTDQSVDVTWRAFDGVILGKPDPRTVVVQWVNSAARGQLCVTRTFPSGCKDSACYDVILRDPVSVDEEWLAGDATVRLAPNPASSTLRLIAAPDAVVDDIEIYTVLGSRVVVIPAGMLSADVSSLAAGAYVVRARVNGQLTTLPLSITR